MSTTVSKKKKLGFMKGQMVYLRKNYGNERGQVDESTVYMIRNIGPKMCTVDRIDKNTHQKTGYRGHNYYLVDQPVAEERNRAHYWSYQAWDWSQLMVPLGAAGWDADCNF